MAASETYCLYSIIQTVNSNNKLILYSKSLRVNQWLKNFVVFTSIVFSGQLFNPTVLIASVAAFFIFCLLSSTSYVFNDIVDYQSDRKHPVKRFRPIASGKISIQEATFVAFILAVASLVFSLMFSVQFFLLAVLFAALHAVYTLFLKKHSIIDIFTISFSFMIRAFAGVLATNFSIPIWLMFTIFFGSLFVATVKRDAELYVHGREARAALGAYREHLLSFLTTTFATSTILAYSFYTYFERISGENARFTEFFNQIIPQFEARKWMMVTIPFVVYGIARYAQLLYDKSEGERPEEIITKDKPLITTMGLWGLTVILLLYIL